MPRLNDIIADGQALGRSGNSPAGLDAVTQAELDAAIEGVSGTTAHLQSPTVATLNDALASGGHVVVSGSVTVGAPIVIPSSTHLHLAADATLTRQAGYLGNLVRNSAVSATATRDSDISFTFGPGASIDGGDNATATGLALHHVYFRNVDGLRVDGFTAHTEGGKYALLLYACTAFEVTESTFETSSDGIHLTGTCSDGRIAGVYGTTSDDSVAITTVDYAAYNDGDLGDAHDITIERVHTTNAAIGDGVGTGNGVKVLPGSIAGTPTRASNITVRDVSSVSGGGAVWLGGDTAQAGTYGGEIGHVTVENVRNDGTGFGVRLWSMTFDHITIRNVACPPDSGRYAVEFYKGVTGGTLTLEDCRWEPVAGTYALAMRDVAPHSSVETIVIDNCVLEVATQSAGLFTQLSASNVVNRIKVSNYRCKQGAWAIGDFFGTVDLHLTNVSLGAANGLYNVRTGATVNLVEGHTPATLDLGLGGVVKRSTYYFAPAAGAISTGAPGQGQLTYTPLPVLEPLTLDRIGIEVTTAVADSTCRLGLYLDNDGRPGRRLLDAGTIDASTIGVKELTISQLVPRGRLWLAHVSQGGAPTVRRTNNTFHLPGMARTSASTISQFSMASTIDATSYSSGSLPTTAAPGNGQTFSPRVFVRVA